MIKNEIYSSLVMITIINNAQKLLVFVHCIRYLKVPYAPLTATVIFKLYHLNNIDITLLGKKFYNAY